MVWQQCHFRMLIIRGQILSRLFIPVGDRNIPLCLTLTLSRRRNRFRSSMTLFLLEMVLMRFGHSPRHPVLLMLRRMVVSKSVVPKVSPATAILGLALMRVLPLLGLTMRIKTEAIATLLELVLTASPIRAFHLPLKVSVSIFLLD